MQKSGQGTTYRDPVAKVPYYVNPSTKLWVGFDDKTSIYTKVRKLSFLLISIGEINMVLNVIIFHKYM